MEITTQNEPLVLPEGQKIKAFLDKRGIKYSFFAKKMGDFHKSWASNLFSGILKLTDEHKIKLKEVYPELHAELFPDTEN